MKKKVKAWKRLYKHFPTIIHETTLQTGKHRKKNSLLH
jgi:hypothetical protein